MKLSKASLLLLTGIAIGAVAGLLLAPDEGERTRKKLWKKSKKFKKDFEDKAAQYKENLQSEITNHGNQFRNRRNLQLEKINRVGEQHHQNGRRPSVIHIYQRPNQSRRIHRIREEARIFACLHRPSVDSLLDI